jgi:catechol 2,3-dioxygenase-like lactoylglutathione lyase family enzyme
MKTRCFDHIDLRVKNMDVAKEFYGQFLPQLGFVRERNEPSPREEAGGDFHTFYSTGADKPSEFFGFTEDKNHQPNGTRIAFWADTTRKSIILRNWCASRWKNLEGRNLSRLQSGVLRVLFEDPDGNKLKFAAVRVRSLPLADNSPADRVCAVVA